MEIVNRPFLIFALILFPFAAFAESSASSTDSAASLVELTGNIHLVLDLTPPEGNSIDTAPEMPVDIAPDASKPVNVCLFGSIDCFCGNTYLGCAPNLQICNDACGPNSGNTGGGIPGPTETPENP